MLLVLLARAGLQVRATGTGGSRETRFQQEHCCEESPEEVSRSMIDCGGSGDIQRLGHRRKKQQERV